MTVTWERLLEDTKSDKPNDDPYILFNGNEPSALALTWELNPGLPKEYQILVGNSDTVIKKAEKYLKSPLPLPLYMKIGTNKWELLGVFGNPQRIDDPSVYKVNADKRLLNDPKARVSFAIHLTKIS